MIRDFGLVVRTSSLHGSLLEALAGMRLAGLLATPPGIFSQHADSTELEALVVAASYNPTPEVLLA